MAILKVGDTDLPAPVELSTSDEIIWSAETGRVASGKMAGDVIAEKKTLSIQWGVLTDSQIQVIKSNLIAGFFPITFHDDGLEITIESYRGTLTKEHIGRLSDGVYYYRNATVTIIQQ